MLTVLALAGFFAGFLLVFAVNLLFAANQQTRRAQLRERLLEEQRLLQRERARVATKHVDLYELAAESAAQIEGHRPLTERLGIFFEQTGTKLRPMHVVGLTLVVASGAAVTTFLATSSWLLTGLASALGGALPALWVQMMRTRRLRHLLSQLPDAFDLMGRTMRAGQTFMQAMQSVAEEAAAPLALEFAYCYDQQYLGMSTEAALRDLGRRCGLLEIKIFVLAVLVHRQTGGNLSEILEKLARLIRDRYRIAGLISSLTAEGRIQAYILLALPVLLFVALYAINPQYASTLLDYPTLIFATGGLMVVGALWMKKIIAFDS
jgi:tight adherence protein B